jgi:hypothetical protein
MLVHKAVGHSPPPGHWVAGHSWLHRRSLARKFINDYYVRYQLLPRGKHDLASMPAMMNPWVVDFDMLLSSIELDLTHGDISDYPELLRDNIVGALPMG